LLDAVGVFRWDLNGWRVGQGTIGTFGGGGGVVPAFTFLTRDPNGFANIHRHYFQVNGNTSIPPGSCHGSYDRASNGIYLYNDALMAVMGPLIPGAAGTLQNSQCTEHGGTSQMVSASGADLTLRLGLSLQGAFAASTKNVYLWVRDNEANDTGWV